MQVLASQTAHGSGPSEVRASRVAPAQMKLLRVNLVNVLGSLDSIITFVFSTKGKIKRRDRKIFKNLINSNKKVDLFLEYDPFLN